jgi:hypothetical protein
MVHDIKQRLDNMNQTIEASQLNVRHVIETVNENYRSFISANIAHHIHLKDVAEQDGDLPAVMHHQVMSEIYQSILERISYRGSPLQ